MAMKLPAFDHISDYIEQIASGEKTELPGAVFLLAKLQPQAFVGQLTWQVSSDLDALYFDQSVEGAANCFTTPIWLQSWAKTIAKENGTTIKVVTGSIANTTIVAMPLSIVSGKLITRVQFAAQNVSDYNAPIVHQELLPHISPELINEIFEQAARLFPEADCLDFRKCLLLDITPQTGKLHWRPDPEKSHICSLSGDWEYDLSRFIGKSSQRSLKRKLKKLEGLGGVTFSIADTPEQIELASDKLIEWKTSQLEELGAANIFKNQGFRNFLQTTALEDQTGTIRLFGIYVDDAPVAIVHMLCRENRWFLYQTAYTSQEAGKYSPGYLLLLNIMERACRNGVEVFDFGWGNEAYKSRFASQSLVLYNAFLPLTLKGRAAMLIGNGKALAKKKVKSSKIMRQVAKLALRGLGNIQNKLK